MSNRMRNLTRLAAVIAIAAGTLALPTTNASAGAYGCSAWGAGTVGKYPVAKGAYCANLDGSGTYVRTVGGGFDSVGNVCNWSITAEFFNASGNWYQTITSPTNYRCDRKAQAAVYVGAHKQRGFMCSTLKQNGARVTSVCHNIH